MPDPTPVHDRRRLRALFDHGSTFPRELAERALGRVHGPLDFDAFLEGLDEVAFWDDLADRGDQTVPQRVLVEAVRHLDAYIDLLPERDQDHLDLPNPERVLVARIRNRLGGLLAPAVVKHCGVRRQR